MNQPHTHMYIRSPSQIEQTEKLNYLLNERRISQYCLRSTCCLFRHVSDSNVIDCIYSGEFLKIKITNLSISFQVYVCPSLANLYENVNKSDWRLKYTGVPVLIHDKGSARSRNLPRVTFILAERGSCFALWQDTIDNLSAYRVAGPAFHTMCLSSGKCHNS